MLPNTEHQSALPDWIEAPGLTLEEQRDADDAFYAYLISLDIVLDPHLRSALGLTGTHMVSVTLMDTDCDYTLPALSLTFTRDMTAWDVMRVASWHWIRYPVMNDLTIASLAFAEGGGRVSLTLFSAPGVALSDDQVEHLPW